MPASSSRGRPARLSGRRSALVGILLLLIVAGAGYFYFFRGPVYQSGDFQGFNVLLVTIDTLRADHLPAYGYKEIKTPHLDRLASHSFVFEDAIAHAPMTLPSHTSILTGMLPIGHGVRDNGGFLVDRRIDTLAEILKNNGYTTAAFVSSFVLDSRWQLDQGFDVYFDNFGIQEFQGLNPRDIQRRADETEIEVEHWLENSLKQPFFSWVHFYDPHDPYEPPEPYRTEYAGRPYDGEIAYTDEVLGRLLDKLERLKLEDRTIIIVTADHGEGLGEHNEMMHALFIYNTTQHVPLFIALPGTRGKRIRGVVQHVDLAPTLLDWLGIPVPKKVQGSSLLPLINGDRQPNRSAFSESLYAELHYGWSPLQSMTTDQYKYIDAPRAELYDRVADPREMNNLAGSLPYVAKAMKDRLAEWLERYSSKDLGARAKLDPDTEEKLRALGYIAATVESTAESRKIDPKDKIHLAQAIQLTMAAVNEKNYEQALQLLQPVLQEEPDMTDAHLFAAVAYGNLREYEKAKDELLKTIALRPDYTTAMYNLGWIHETQGEFTEAERWFLKVLDREEEHMMATIQMARIYRQTKQESRAEPYIRKAVGWYTRAIDATKGADGRSTLHATLGELYFSLGELEPAEVNLRKAIELGPDKPDLHFNLAQIHEAHGDITRAATEYEEETRVNPGNFKAHMNLGLMYLDTNRLDGAASHFQKILELRPNDPHAAYLLAKTYLLADRNLDQARRLAEASVQTDAQFKKGYLLLASIYKRLGRERDAYETYKKAM